MKEICVIRAGIAKGMWGGHEKPRQVAGFFRSRPTGRLFLLS